jgi:hypothetical protein
MPRVEQRSGLLCKRCRLANPPDALRCVTLMQLPEEIVQIFPHDWAIAQ